MTPPAHHHPRRSLVAAGLVVLGMLGVSACASGAGATHRVVRGPAAVPTAAPATALAPFDRLPSAGSPAALPALDHRLRPDVLVLQTHGLPPATVAQVAHLSPDAVTYSAGNVQVNGTSVRVASVDPAAFRRYAAQGTAETTAVWQAVARGDAVASHALATQLHLPLGGRLGVIGAAGSRPADLRLGALATTGIPGTDLVVDTATGRALGLVAPTAVLLSAGAGDPAVLAAKARAAAGAAAEVDLLTAPAADPVAFLSGGKAAKAFGAFSYRYFPDGTIEPDARWVAANIQSGAVPILGRVTCHRLMLPQLRGALQEVADAGLAGSLHSYDGCYVPRFIERDPHHPVSLHTWGIAIDLDASTNDRGIRGTMDPRVVAIFKRWGFRWGGDWSYTDPMHFELGALRS